MGEKVTKKMCRNATPMIIYTYLRLYLHTEVERYPTDHEQAQSLMVLPRQKELDSQERIATKNPDSQSLRGQVLPKPEDV